MLAANADYHCGSWPALCTSVCVFCRRCLPRLPTASARQPSDQQRHSAATRGQPVHGSAPAVNLQGCSCDRKPHGTARRAGEAGRVASGQPEWQHCGCFTCSCSSCSGSSSSCSRHVTTGPPSHCFNASLYPATCLLNFPWYHPCNPSAGHRICPFQCCLHNCPPVRPAVAAAGSQLRGSGSCAERQ